jgi:hypothetical protein
MLELLLFEIGPIFISILIVGFAQFYLQDKLFSRKIGWVLGAILPTLIRVGWAIANSSPPNHDFQPHLAILFSPLNLIASFFVARMIAKSSDQSSLK